MGDRPTVKTAPPHYPASQKPAEKPPMRPNVEPLDKKTPDGTKVDANITMKSDISAPQNPSSSPASKGFISKLKSIAGFKAMDQTHTTSSSLMQNGFGDAQPIVSAPRTRREMIERVIAFDEKRVFDVMLPRADIAAVELDTSMSQLIQIFSKEGHSRMPVYRGDLDDPLGMVHIKDLIEMIAENGDKQNQDKAILNDLLRKVLYVPPSMRVVDLFLRMQASRIHMALVIDEYGGTDGLVTIEDLVEQIVGEINDEHDDVEGPLIQKRENNSWDADARIELEELSEIIGYDLSESEDEVDTLGGLVVSLAGRVPLRGEVISHVAGLELEVIDADARRIRKICIRLVKDKTDKS